jgi:hypothetical protein
MTEVSVRIHVAARRDVVFAAATDHETFLRSADGATTARVVRAGDPAPNGLGCLREVSVGGKVRYLEEITAWEPPAAFGYTIRKTSLPLRHAGSRLTFTPRDGGTDVQWTSRFTVPIPVLGRLLERRAKRLYENAFAALLADAKARLEAATPRRP